MKRKRFSRPLLAAIDASHFLRIRAGARSGHRFIAIWAVVANGRVFARSWTLKRGGWYRTFLDEPLGAIQVGDRIIRIRTVRARGERIRDAVERVYAAKYRTPASIKYVRGFRSARRRETTIEFVPR